MFDTTTESMENISFTFWCYDKRIDWKGMPATEKKRRRNSALFPVPLLTLFIVSRLKELLTYGFVTAPAENSIKEEANQTYLSVEKKKSDCF